ncbi:hypothetical protein HPB51_002758 [Rhipicephalus microplus]|uniref:Uncharacterized protein n=1 Tax=Rhipicephalus microplus TaxID=6941 RepID=A0A9J6EWA5_RHIMP|nr:hypothetical protein HPB51_002758 [Rhipicephalus microplus]
MLVTAMCVDVVSASVSMVAPYLNNSSQTSHILGDHHDRHRVFVNMHAKHVSLTHVKNPLRLISTVSGGSKLRTCVLLALAGSALAGYIGRGYGLGYGISHFGVQHGIGYSGLTGFAHSIGYAPVIASGYSLIPALPVTVPVATYAAAPVVAAAPAVTRVAAIPAAPTAIASVAAAPVLGHCSRCSDQEILPTRAVSVTNHPNDHIHPLHSPASLEVLQKADLWRTPDEQRSLCFHYDEPSRILRYCPHKRLELCGFALNAQGPRPGKHPGEVEYYLSRVEYWPLVHHDHHHRCTAPLLIAKP